MSLTKAESPRVASMDLCASTTVLGQEGLRTLELEEQITRLFDELREPVYRYVLCLRVGPAEADDIIQETFLRLYRHLHAGGREDNLRGWVFRVAHNISINEIKSHRHLVASEPEQWAELSAGADQTPGPEELLLRKEKMVRVHAAISRLSEQQKHCLYLRAEGFRYREIADILGVTISTVAESLRRAINNLTKEFHE
jgi:RNA polymerase sigma-70 factor, ECF subfamily